MSDFKLTPEQQEWFDNQTKKPEYVNPCVRAYGKGPEGKTCKSCRRLFRKHMGKTYIKCDLRENTNGPGSDHKAGWPACAKYVGNADIRQAGPDASK